jgi:hypothetical protein
MPNPIRFVRDWLVSAERLPTNCKAPADFDTIRGPEGGDQAAVGAKPRPSTWSRFRLPRLTVPPIDIEDREPSSPKTIASLDTNAIIWLSDRRTRPIRHKRIRIIGIADLPISLMVVRRSDCEPLWVNDLVEDQT